MSDDNLVKTDRFSLYLNGALLSDELYSSIEEVTVEDEINLPCMFNLTFNIRNFDDEKWQGIDLETFKLGDAVKVNMGMDKIETMMSGEITSLEPTFDVSPSMEIRGYDRLHRLRLGTFRRSFKDMKDSDIASSIVSESGLTPQVENTTTVNPYVFQNNLTNYEFLLERAERIGFEMVVDDKKFIYRKSQEDQDAVTELNYGIELQNFSAQLKALTVGSSVEFRGWDIKKKEKITSKASKGDENTLMSGKETGFQLSESAYGDTSTSVLDNLLVGPSDAEGVAKAKYNVMLKQFLSGSGECLGDPKIRAGKTIKLNDLGSRYSGTYYVVSSVHSCNYETGYITRFKVRRTGA